jgi:hypothetical protein
MKRMRNGLALAGALGAMPAHGGTVTCSDWQGIPTCQGRTATPTTKWHG